MHACSFCAFLSKILKYSNTVCIYIYYLKNYFYAKKNTSNKNYKSHLVNNMEVNNNNKIKKAVYETIWIYLG